MSTMPNSPTLLRQFPAPKPNAQQFIGMNILAEMDRQQIDRKKLAEMLGWTEARLSTRLSGKRLTVPDYAKISGALGVGLVYLFAGMNRATVRSGVTV
jgi:transcriptional regulator with XRE-family HTH domain